MSKSFAVKDVVSDRIVIHTTDGGGSVVLDQDDPDGNPVSLLTDLFSKGILLQNDPNAALQLIGGNLFLFTPNGNVLTTASQDITNASREVLQSLITMDRTVIVDPADAVYNQFDNGSAGGINVSSRLDIAPDATGTTINSIILNPPDPNPNGRIILISNIGTAVGQVLTLTNLSPAGTAGGLIRAPIDYAIPAGGGAIIVFNGGENVWSVIGI